MSKDKIKRMQQAEKFVLQGKVAQAIAEYRKIAHDYPADMSVLNTIGDLCIRKGYIQEAAMYFADIAESYLKTGFTLRAIAMYKKIHNLDPQNLDTTVRLAELYAKQGLTLESKKQYLSVADVYSKKGMPNKAAEYYKNIIELDPKDAEVGLKLADIYLSQGAHEEAKTHYSNAGIALAKSRAYEEGAKALKKALDLDPLDTPTLRGFLDLSIALGPAQVKEAIAMLESVCRQKSDDTNLLQMLGEAYLSCDQADKAEKIFQQVITADRDRVHLFFALGSYYYDRNDLNKAAEQMNHISNILVSRREPEKVISFLKEILDVDPKHLPSLFTLADIYYKTNNEEKYIGALDKVADYYIEQGNYIEALNVLEKLIQTSFNNPKFQNLHKQVFMEAYPDKEYPADRFESKARSETPLGEVTAAPPQEGQVFVTGQPGSISSTEIDLSDELKGGSLEEIFGAGEAEKEEKKAVDNTLSTNLQEIDFYIRLGFYKEAEKRLSELETSYPNEKEIQLRYRQIEDAKISVPRTEADSEEKKLLDEIEGHQKSTYTIQPLEGIKADKDAPSAKENLFEDLLKEAQAGEEKEDFRTHYDLGVAYKEMELLDDAIGEFQLAYRIAKSQGASSSLASCCTILANCLLEKGMPGSAVKWCKFGLSSSGLSDDEVHALKYELANAYEKCGEFKLALDCLNDIYEMNASYRDVSDKIDPMTKLLNGNQ